MPAIYQGRGNLIDEGILRQYAAAKGGVLSKGLDAMAEIPEKRARRQREMDEHRTRVLQNEELMRRASPEALRLDLDTKTAQFEAFVAEREAANFKLQLAKKDLEDQTAAMAAQDALAATSIQFLGLGSNPASAAEFLHTVKTDPTFSKSPRTLLYANKLVDEWNAANKDKTWAVDVPGGRPVYMSTDEALQHEANNRMVMARNPKGIVWPTRRATMQEVEAAKIENSLELQQWRLDLAERRAQSAATTATIRAEAAKQAAALRQTTLTPGIVSLVGRYGGQIDAAPEDIPPETPVVVEPVATE